MGATQRYTFPSPGDAIWASRKASALVLPSALVREGSVYYPGGKGKGKNVFNERDSVAWWRDFVLVTAPRFIP